MALLILSRASLARFTAGATVTFTAAGFRAGDLRLAFPGAVLRAAFFGFAGAFFLAVAIAGVLHCCC